MKEGDYLMDDPFIRAAVFGVTLGLGVAIGVTAFYWSASLVAAFIG